MNTAGSRQWWQAGPRQIAMVLYDDPVPIGLAQPIHTVDVVFA